MDRDTSNNTAVSIGGTITSFDPNAIHVDRETLFEVDLDDVVLEYLVQFQNTGNGDSICGRADNVLKVNTAAQHSSSRTPPPRELQFDGRTGLMQSTCSRTCTGQQRERGQEPWVTCARRALVHYEGDTITNTLASTFDLNDPPR